MADRPVPDQTLDLRHKQCPFTILELGKILESAASGDLIEVLLEGPAALEEIRIWCRKTGRGIEETPETKYPGPEGSDARGTRIYVRKPQ